MYIGLVEAQIRHIKKLVIAGDSLVVLQAVNELDKSSDWTIYPLVNDIRSVLNSLESWQTRKIH